MEVVTVLLAALVQGLGLYRLHFAVDAHHDPAWITALYAAVIFGPLTIQLLSRYVRNPFMWVLAATVTGAFFYFGWHEGATRLPRAKHSSFPFDDYFAFCLALAVLWLLLLPFVQSRLEAGRWRVPYGTLFANAWRNKLVLAEAALFTGLFWLLLWLWTALFGMLKIAVFEDLFTQPLFAYPVTSLAFGVALHLIGSVDRLTAVVLEQLLNVLKWLALVACSLLMLFTVALVFKLPGLVFAGERAISAAWLLWLVAVIVLLLNAAFRDGSVERPYPHWIATALRFAVPLLAIISLVALYALMIRVRHYGMTVERFWACVVGGVLLIYAVGYSIAAFSRGPWMAAIARVNVLVALVLISVIAVTLTPVLAPDRLAANSQFARILNWSKDLEGSPFVYLRFDSGTYGFTLLRKLAALPDNRLNAADIRRFATLGLAMEYHDNLRVDPAQDDLREIFGKVPIYPPGRTLTPDLLETLLAQTRNGRADAAQFVQCSRNVAVDGDCLGLFLDLNDDGVDELLLLHPGLGWVFEQRAGKWTYSGMIWMQSGSPWSEMRRSLDRGEFSAIPHRWKNLAVGKFRFRLDEVP